MRKIITLVLVAVASVMGSICADAQDIILTKSSEIIKAKVIEINDDYVIYKAFGNLEGPSYKLSKSKVLKINYQNGSEDVFGSTPAMNVVEPLHSLVPGGLTYSSGDLFNNGVKLTDGQLMQMLSPECYSSFSTGRKMRNAGKALIIVGSCLEGMGIVFTAVGATGMIDNAISDYTTYDPTYYTFYAVGVTSIVTGLGCLGAGIPLFCVGKHKIKKAGSSYNLANGYPEIALNLGSTRNGFGLYLNF